MIKSDKWISSQSVVQKYDLQQMGKKPMIEPFFGVPVRFVNKADGTPSDFRKVAPDTPVPDHLRPVISFGRSSFGYDVRFTTDHSKIKVFTNISGLEIDPKNILVENFATPAIRKDESGAEYVLVPPHSYIQGPTMEYFRIPRDVLVNVIGKSTYARSALIVNVTPIEPEFEGEVVIEIANTASSPVRVYLGEGCAQFCFFQSDEDCEVSYKDKNGKYQGQTGLTFAKV